MAGRAQVMFGWVVGAMLAFLAPNALWAADCKTGASLLVQAEQALSADEDPSDDVCSIVPEQGEDLNGCDTSVPPPAPPKPPVPSSEQVPELFYTPSLNTDSLGDSLRVPCWVSEDTCHEPTQTPDFRLPVGHAVGYYDKASSSRFAGATAYFVAGRCGSAEDAGSVPSDQQLVIYLAYGIGADESMFDSGTVLFTISVKEYTNTSCSRTERRSLTSDTATCPVSVANSDVGWRDAWSDSRRDCAGAQGDIGDCHIPDIAIDYPGEVGDYSYKYTITVSTCDSDGSNCTQGSQDGCFVINWVN